VESLFTGSFSANRDGLESELVDKPWSAAAEGVAVEVEFEEATEEILDIEVDVGSEIVPWEWNKVSKFQR